MAHLTADLVVVEQGIPNVIDIDASWSKRPFTEPPLSAASELMLDAEVLYDFESSTGKSENETTPPTTRSIASTKSSGIDHLPIDDRFAKWTSAYYHVLNGDPTTFAFDLTKMSWAIFNDIRVSHELYLLPKVGRLLNVVVARCLSVRFRR